jgi:NitT/TauT family transport system permease protein
MIKPSKGKKGVNIAFFVFKRVIVIAVLLVIWWVGPLYMENPNMYIPSLKTVIEEFGRVVANGEFAENVFASLGISLASFLISTAISVPVGVLLGWYKSFEEYLDPLLTFLRNMPIMAVLPLFVLLFGTGSSAKIIVLVWATFFPTMINTVQGVKSADPTLIRSAQSMAVGPIGILTKVIIPSASPYIIAGLRLSAGITLLVVIAAELLGARYGIGFQINRASSAYMIPKMYVYILTISIIGVVVNGLLLRLEKRLMHWRETPNAL